MYSSTSGEDKSDTEYRIELERSDWNSSSSSEEERIRKSNSKRRKKKSTEKRRSCKMMNDQGLKWEKEDEMTGLKRLYEFSGNMEYFKSGLSYKNSKEFYEGVKSRLVCYKNMRSSEVVAGVSVNEVNNKIEELRKRFLKNERLVKDDNLVFVSEEEAQHEWKVFLMSKKIWRVLANPEMRERHENAFKMKDAEGFLQFLHEMEIDINSLMPSCLESLIKDWKVQLLMYNELLSKKSNFDAKLTHLIFSTTNHPLQQQQHHHPT